MKAEGESPGFQSSLALQGQGCGGKGGRKRAHSLSMPPVLNGGLQGSSQVLSYPKISHIFQLSLVEAAAVG